MFHDQHYLCQGLGHLTGLETRIFLGDVCEEHYQPVPFEPDVLGLIHQDPMDTRSVCYIETEDLLVFGIIRSQQTGHRLILGPTLHIKPDKPTLVRLLTHLGQPIERLSELMTYFDHVVTYPLENFLQILCFLNYAINDERVAVVDLLTTSIIKMPVTQEHEEDNQNESNEPHNTYQMEKDLVELVRTGDVESIRRFLVSPPSGRIGTLAHSELRQRKNAFIVAATLFSRAAISGGLSTEMAFAISDRYIQKVEFMSQGQDIAQLNIQMLLDYTQRVEALKLNTDSSLLARNIHRYIKKNITKKITLDELAKHIGMNRSYLCERFKSDTGMTISQFLRHMKIDEAKRLIETTNLTMAQISDYLSFSSQSHFQSVFKSVEHLTPIAYKKQLTQ